MFIIDIIKYRTLLHNTMLQFTSIIPLMWRYLLRQYIKIFLFCVLTFIAVLITSRLDDIAHFAALGPSIKLILTFTALQIPYILPIAIPIAALIASMIVIHKLSASHEITALRASGIAIQRILTPLLLAAFLLAILNFVIISEVATSSHMQANFLKKELRSINPLLLLKHKHLMRSKGFYFDSLGSTHAGESVNLAYLAIPHQESGRMHLMLAEKLSANSENFHGDHVSLITPLDGSNNSRLLIEHAEKSDTSIQDFLKITEKKIFSVNNDYLRLPLLLARMEEQKSLMQTASTKIEFSQAEKSYNKSISEVLKRISVGLAPFTFSLMGMAFALSISRYRSNRSTLLVILLASLYLMCFFAGQNLGHQLLLSITLYFLPHLIIITCSLWTLTRISHGYESKLL